MSNSHSYILGFFYRYQVLILIVLCTLSNSVNSQRPTINYAADFSGASRYWIGPEWWANPPYDCAVGQSRVKITAAPERTAVLLPYRIHPSPYSQNGKKNSFKLTTNMKFSPSYRKFVSTAGGFRIGRKGDPEIQDYRREMLQAVRYVDVLFFPNTRKLQFGDTETIIPQSKVQTFMNSEHVIFDVTCEAANKQALLCNLVIQDKNKRQTHSIQKRFNNGIVIAGGISLLTNGPSKWIAEANPRVTVSFFGFKLSGNLVAYTKSRTFGPILWTQFLPPQNGLLKLQAQLAYLPPKQTASLSFRSIGKVNGKFKWNLVKVSDMEADSKTVLFNVRIPTAYTKAKVQRVYYRVIHKFNGKSYRWNGSFPMFQKPTKKFRLASLSCDNGYLFPNTKLVNEVSRSQPDLLAFLGDQIYESGGLYGTYGFARFHEPHRIAIQDFFYKYYSFAWTWRDLLSYIPSVIIPDDHDYYQGNIWGARGAKLPVTSTDWARGGFVMSSKFIRSVERIYTGHFPLSPFNNLVLKPANIKTYFTSFKFANIDFIILEDRKFKSAPNAKIPENQLQLLGPEQEQYLKKWSQDWSGSTEMKVAFSQTAFCSPATHRGYGLPRVPFFQDSGAWPKKPRQTAVKYLTNARAFSLHGDQHLGMLLQNFENDFWEGSGQYSFSVPGTANGFPRAWWPGVRLARASVLNGLDFTGRFKDDGKNAINVVAVANPNVARQRASNSKGGWMQAAYDKGSGWGLSVFNVNRRSVNVNLFRTGTNMRGETFRGFPKNIFVGGKKDTVRNILNSTERIDEI